MPADWRRPKQRLRDPTRSRRRVSNWGNGTAFAQNLATAASSSARTSIRITVTSIIAIIIVSCAMTFVSAERVHVDLVENDPQQFVMNSRSVAQCVLGNIDFGAAPFDHKHKRINYGSHDA